MTKQTMITPGCYFEPEEDEVKNPIVGKRIGGHMPNEPVVFWRRSELEDIPDNFLERMRARRNETLHSVSKKQSTYPLEVVTPDGFAVSIAYNKSGYMLIPKEDLKR